MKRASRTGPLEVMNEGTVFVAPCFVASAICGLGTGTCGLKGAGLVPPVAGCAWHIAQLLPLNVGPSPTPGSPAMVPETESTSLNTPSAELKKAFSLALRAGNGPPAEAAPPRGPGSTWARQ